MGFLLDIAYLAIILLAFPWLLYQRLRHGKYREGWPAKFCGLIPHRSGDRPCLWLHAVSVGEINLLEPILKRWERLHPDWRASQRDAVAATCTSDTLRTWVAEHDDGGPGVAGFVAIQLDHNLAESYGNLGWLTRSRGNLVEAEGLLKQALALDPVTHCKFRIPAGAGAALHLLHERARVLKSRYRGEICELDAEVPASIRRQLSDYVVSK